MFQSLPVEGWTETSAEKYRTSPGLGISPGEGNHYPLQYSGLENSMDCIVHGVTESWTQLSNFLFHFHKDEIVKTIGANLAG